MFLNSLLPQRTYWEQQEAALAEAIGSKTEAAEGIAYYLP